MIMMECSDKGRSWGDTLGLYGESGSMLVQKESLLRQPQILRHRRCNDNNYQRFRTNVV